ncbi:putative MFS family arabinose efflux permease [Thermosporothrix hazakensis]|jgi:MFS family permease|uniref:Putative MFS family arabinose efflux permease n=1 Tax=Thermosporothrix hazakensis TaxID=644383 RepID=A0A326UDI1_THEHA|nr:MFS transporter [Thermosporothrix hazakensis]PZW36104.1 putative MFS family arabinose efflux permease [Thermosporothrix hazakensis]GCE46755.1 MFS transporter [Thermosporothrix hazakensis]
MTTISTKEEELQEQDLARIEAKVEKATKGFLRTFAALKHRNYRLFFTGQMISQIGTWMQTTGQAWLVLTLTHSAWALGVIGALQFLPVMIFSLFGGVLADKLPKRTVLVFTQTAAMLQAALLWTLVITGTVQLWHLFIFATLLGLTNSLDMPTRQAFVAEMVGREDLPNAVALNSSLVNMARVVGPGIGGLLIAWLGNAPLFLLNAISFIPVILGLLLIDARKLHTHNLSNHPKYGRKVSTFQSLAEGFRYIGKTPIILLVILVLGSISLFGINFNILIPIFATDVLRGGPESYGFLSAAYGIGSLIGALLLASRSTRSPVAQWLLLGMGFSTLEIMFAFSHWYWLSLILIAFVGLTQVSFTATANTTLQTVSPDHLRGRIMSVYMLVFAGSTPLGNLLMGGLANTIGASLGLAVGAVLCLISAFIGWALRAPAEKNIEQVLYAKR